MKLAAILTLTSLSAVWAQSICDVTNEQGDRICQCVGSQVRCTCDSSFKDLILNGIDILMPTNMIDVQVRNCSLLQLGPTVKMNASSASFNVRDVAEFRVTNISEVVVSNLRVSHVQRFGIQNGAELSVAVALNVSRVRHFLVENGTQLRVTHLHVNDVQRIDLGDTSVRDNAQRAQSFHFRDSTLANIRRNAFRRLHLSILEFTNCQIGAISSDAVSDAFKTLPDSRFVMSNCTVGPVDANGLEISAAVVHIDGNQFNGRLDSSSVRVRRLADVKDFTFSNNRVRGHLVNETFHLNGIRNVRFCSNDFAFVHRGSFLGVNADRLVLVNNTARSSRGVPFMLSCNNCNITNNRLPCDCLSLEEMQADMKQFNGTRMQLANQILSNPCTHDASTNPLTLIKAGERSQCHAASANSVIISNILVIIAIVHASM